MRKKNIVTLKKLALDLGLSISTVSRALNNHVDISEETKERVKAYANKVKYAPNLFARGFRSHKSNIIGVIIPNIEHQFTATLLKGIIYNADLNGYKVIICESFNNEQKQAALLETMVQFGVDGVLLSLVKKNTNVDDILDMMQHIPLILFDRVSAKVPCTQIVIDDEEAAFKAVEHLINTGKKRIAIIKETESSILSEKRYAGYLKALKKYGIDLDESLVMSCENLTIAEGKKLAKVLVGLQHKPDGIFAITDEAGIGAIQVLTKNKIKIPEDVAVVGFSNSVYSTIIKPKLTTIDQPGNRIGEVAIKYLIDEINSDTVISYKTIEIKTNLIVRGSSFKSLKRNSLS
ncbi:MAG: LacI family transcriptional regulator [Flavobacteriaceae bacterium]|jgi:LacI family transcriptional regulator|uniref:LacI family DNA-binding transcriptional regulator n=1 Tax=Flavobacterium kayseriense TaxID=2764714 RepID=A0ABR7J4C1_9FLAO|nr:LacI family DNA-binding transcriptional regulator [Flavobacterium kayseriense]MBC5840394.1 LacI family DNA-binding transcriptional regulator [Flavobacterium kayseriense]MBC5846936.1 LacI family DNA-binding transcriptional regulator [Flavobacterium kayseriense]MBU0942604.1 LacI family transcriptional regulator [Bacteroidota bacterium]MBX9888208.1 LacI family transcriptional regulator [Flavobacteriaceae bacterium]